MAALKRAVYCLCAGVDDGAPMILCDVCNDWLHFRCINLAERDADDIRSYICARCHASSGLHTVYDWEGLDALEPVATTPSPPQVPADASSPEGPQDTSADEYKEGGADRATKRRRLNPKLNVGRNGAQRASSPSPSQSSAGSLADVAPEGGRTSATKRKASGSGKTHAKRKKVEASRDDDPTRKYCAGKLLEVISPIFHEHFPPAAEQPALPLTDSAELANEEKERASNNASAFVANLEQAIWDLYSEPDKNGIRTANTKYKERFRMLTFNLAKKDRVVLRRGIAHGELSASELAQMSSTDLASEKAKHEIEIAHKESLEHSILEPRVTAPRAKITHKGEEVIEDEAQSGSTRARDYDEPKPSSKRTLPPIQTQTDRFVAEASPATATSTLTTPPLRHMQSILTDALSKTPQSASSFPPMLFGAGIRSAWTDDPLPSDSLDVTNMDLDDPVSAATAAAVPTRPLTPPPPSAIATQFGPPMGTDISTMAQDFTISPRRHSSFDFQSLWTDSKDTSSPQVPGAPLAPVDAYNATDGGQSFAEPPAAGDLDLGATDDRDFDMFLQDEPGATEPSIDNVEQSGADCVTTTGANAAERGVESSDELTKRAYESLPVVWKGTLSMPVDAATITCGVRCRQVGGNVFSPVGPSWPKMIPLRELKVEGRVPIKNGSEYLVQSRFNSARELIAVEFAPSAPEDQLPFDETLRYLSERGRYGVILPWGDSNQPHAPGKELYIIPLLPSTPLPESIELIDNLRLPAKRERGVMLGVLVLHRGRIVDPQPASFAAASTQALPVQTESGPSTYQLARLPSLQAAPVPQTRFIPAMPVGMPSYHVVSPAPPAGSLPDAVNLTPEQVHVMLRTLGALQSSQPPAQVIPATPHLYPPATQMPPPPAVHPPVDRVDHGQPHVQSSYPSIHGLSPHVNSDRGRGRGGPGAYRPSGAVDFERQRDSGWGPRGRGRGHTFAGANGRGR